MAKEICARLEGQSNQLVLPYVGLNDDFHLSVNFLRFLVQLEQTSK
jgi:hypothetical protein